MPEIVTVHCTRCADNCAATQADSARKQKHASATRNVSAGVQQKDAVLRVMPSSSQACDDITMLCKNIKNNFHEKMDGLCA